MTGKFEEAISGLKTLAITKRRQAQSSGESASHLEMEAKAYRTSEARLNAEAVELDDAVQVLALLGSLR